MSVAVVDHNVTRQGSKNRPKRHTVASPRFRLRDHARHVGDHTSRAAVLRGVRILQKDRGCRHPFKSVPQYPYGFDVGASGFPLIWVLYGTKCVFHGLTVLVGWQGGHPACKNGVVRYWRGYLSGAMCK